MADTALSVANTAQRAALQHVGVNATVTPGQGVPRTIRVFFQSTSLDDFGVLQPQPQMRAIAADIADLGTGDAVAVNGISYRIRALSPDPFGLTTAVLSDS